MPAALCAIEADSPYDPFDILDRGARKVFRCKTEVPGVTLLTCTSVVCALCIIVAIRSLNGLRKTSAEAGFL